MCANAHLLMQTFEIGSKIYTRLICRLFKQEILNVTKVDMQ